MDARSYANSGGGRLQKNNKDSLLNVRWPRSIDHYAII